MPELPILESSDEQLDDQPDYDFVLALGDGLQIRRYEKFGYCEAGWNPFCDPFEMSCELDHNVLLAIYTNLVKVPVQSDLDELQLSINIWQCAKSMANFVHEKDTPPPEVRRGPKGPRRRTDKFYVLKYDPSNVEHAKIFRDLPDQARACLETILVSDMREISEPDLQKLIKDSPILRTRQDRWRIFQYYRASLVKRGLLEVSE